MPEASSPTAQSGAQGRGDHGVLRVEALQPAGRRAVAEPAPRARKADAASAPDHLPDPPGPDGHREQQRAGCMHSRLSPGCQATRCFRTRGTFSCDHGRGYRPLLPPARRHRLGVPADTTLIGLNQSPLVLALCSLGCSGTARHDTAPPAPAVTTAPRRASPEGPTGVLSVTGDFPAVTVNGRMHGDYRAAFPQAATLGRRQPSRDAHTIRRSGPSLLPSGRCQ
jgi:hypothetical protein